MQSLLLLPGAEGKPRSGWVLSHSLPGLCNPGTGCCAGCVLVSPGGRVSTSASRTLLRGGGGGTATRVRLCLRSGAECPLLLSELKLNKQARNLRKMHWLRAAMVLGAGRCLLHKSNVQCAEMPKSAQEISGFPSHCPQPICPAAGRAGVSWEAAPTLVTCSWQPPEQVTALHPLLQ